MTMHDRWAIFTATACLCSSIALGTTDNDRKTAALRKSYAFLPRLKVPNPHPWKALTEVAHPLIFADPSQSPGAEDAFGRNLSMLRMRGEGGDLEAQALLGIIYYMGVGVPVDLDQAQIWLRKAAERGHPGAQVKLAAMCFQGQGMPVDLPQSAGWFRMAADQGEPHALACLGVMCAAGAGVPQDPVEAYALLLQAQAGGIEDGRETLFQLKRLLTPGQIEDGKRRTLEAIGKRNPLQS